MLLQLEPGYKPEDLQRQYRALIAREHADVAPKSDLGTCINNAPDTIILAKG